MNNIMFNTLGNTIPTDWVRRYLFDGNGTSITNTNNATVTNGTWVKSERGYQLQCLSWGASTSCTYTSVTYTNSYIWIYASGVWTFTKNSTKVTATALNGVNGERYALFTFFNRTLTEDEEQLLKLEGLRKLGPTNIAKYPSLLSGLVGYWDMRGTAHNLVNGVLATVTGATLTTDRFGNAEGAYSFNGTTQNIQIADSNEFSPSTTGILSFFAWVKTTNISGSTYYKVIGSKYTSGTASTSEWFLSTSNDNRLVISGNGTNTVLVNQTITDGNWHLVGCCIRSTGAKIYYEGNVIATGNLTLGNNTNTATRIGYFASASASNEGWNGQIGESFFFNRELSSDEVKLLYNLTSQDYIYPTPSYDLESLRDGLVLDLNEQGQDLSGNGNNGSPFNLAYPQWLRQGRIKGLSYNGNNAYIGNIGMNNITLGNSDKTIALWIKPGYTADRVMYVLGNSGTNTQLGLGLHTVNQIKAYIFGGPDILSGVTANKIHHIVLSKNGNEYKLYVDGVLRNTTTYANLNITGTQHQVGVNGATNFFNGGIFNPRVRNRALSGNEIQALYYSQKGNFIY